MHGQIPEQIARLITEDPDLFNESQGDPAQEVAEIFSKNLGWKNAKVESVKKHKGFYSEDDGEGAEVFMAHATKKLGPQDAYEIKISYDVTTQPNTPHWSSSSWDDEIASGLQIDREPKNERRYMILGHDPAWGKTWDIYGRPAQAFKEWDATYALHKLVDAAKYG